MVGLDVFFSVSDSRYDQVKLEECVPPPPLKRMVASGPPGRKSGRSVSSYDDVP